MSRTSSSLSAAAAQQQRSDNGTTTRSSPFVSIAAVETLLRDETVGTAEMRAALRGLQKALTCPLCCRHDISHGGLLQDPVSLQCGHCFCKACIDAYSCNNYTCPVAGCQFPLQATTSGSFRKVHPTLQTAMASFITICETLQQAQPYWWKEQDAALGCTTSREEEDEAIDFNGNVEQQEVEIYHSDHANDGTDDEQTTASTVNEDEAFGTAQEDQFFAASSF